MDSRRYPIGPFSWDDPHDLSDAARAQRITDIAQLPPLLTTALQDLRHEELTFRYRDGGWTLAQVVHHVADSHANGYARFRLALTEHVPVVKPYDEAAWAELPDACTAPLDDSVALLTGLHARWTALLRAMMPADFQRTFYHPGAGRVLTLDQALVLYAWHGRHHAAHVSAARTRRITTPIHGEA